MNSGELCPAHGSSGTDDDYRDCGEVGQVRCAGLVLVIMGVVLRQDDHLPVSPTQFLGYFAANRYPLTCLCNQHQLKKV